MGWIRDLVLCLGLLQNVHGVASASDPRTAKNILSHRQLEHFPKNLSSDTEYLDLSFNNLTAISATDLTFYQNLTTLNVEFNDIRNLSAHIFANSTKLRRLYLRGNRLSELNTDSFIFLDDLTELSVTTRTLASANVFFNSPNLLDLYLEVEEDIWMPVELFRNQTFLINLTLVLPACQSLPPNLLQPLPNLTKFTLVAKNLDEWPSGLLHELFDNLTHINLQVDMPRIPEDAFLHSCLPTDKHICLLMREVRARQIKEISLDGVQMIPTSLITSLKGLKKLTIKRSNLTSIQRYQIPDLEVLNMSDNHIENVTKNDLSRMTALHSLDLSRNELRYVSGEAFCHLLEVLEMLDVTENNLCPLDSDTMKILLNVPIFRRDMCSSQENVTKSSRLCNLTMITHSPTFQSNDSQSDATQSLIAQLNVSESDTTQSPNDAFNDSQSDPTPSPIIQFNVSESDMTQLPNDAFNDSRSDPTQSPIVQLNVSESDKTQLPNDAFNDSRSDPTQSPFVQLNVSESDMTQLPNEVFNDSRSDPTQSPIIQLNISEIDMTQLPNDAFNDSRSDPTQSPIVQLNISESDMTQSPNDAFNDSRSDPTQSPIVQLNVSESDKTQLPNDAFNDSRSDPTQSPIVQLNVSESDKSQSPNDAFNDSRSDPTQSPFLQLNISESDMTQSPNDAFNDSRSDVTQSPFVQLNISESDMTQSPNDAFNDSRSGVTQFYLAQLNESKSDLAQSPIGQFNESQSDITQSSIVRLNDSQLDITLPPTSHLPVTVQADNTLTHVTQSLITETNCSFFPTEQATSTLFMNEATSTKNSTLTTVPSDRGDFNALEPKPLPRGWFIGILLLVFVIILVSLYFCLKLISSDKFKGRQPRKGSSAATTTSFAGAMAPRGWFSRYGSTRWAAPTLTPPFPLYASNQQSYLPKQTTNIRR